MFVATIALSILLAVVYAMSGSMKLAGRTQSVEIRGSSIRSAARNSRSDHGE